jgi:hypothetical protein
MYQFKKNVLEPDKAVHICSPSYSVRLIFKIFKHENQYLVHLKQLTSNQNVTIQKSYLTKNAKKGDMRPKFFQAA